MSFFASDLYVGGALDRFGEYSEGEIELFATLLKDGDVVVEAGANVGAHTIPLSRLVGSGRMIAAEPQPAVYDLLRTNLWANHASNVGALRGALGAAPGLRRIQTFDYAETGNFGDAKVCDEGDEVAVIVTIDGLALPRCDLIKADVQGMEADVIEGARETIERFAPAIYVEHNDDRVIDLVRSFGYQCWRHDPPLVGKPPFRCESENPNEFDLIRSSNVLCLPPGRAAAGLERFFKQGERT